MSVETKPRQISESKIINAIGAACLKIYVIDRFIAFFDEVQVELHKILKEKNPAST